MKKLFAILALAGLATACNSTSEVTDTSMPAMEECTTSCETECATTCEESGKTYCSAAYEASMSECSASKSECSSAASECDSAAKSECSEAKVCPVTGKVYN